MDTERVTLASRALITGRRVCRVYTQGPFLFHSNYLNLTIAVGWRR